jgi:hypothetical protein
VLKNIPHFLQRWGCDETYEKEEKNRQAGAELCQALVKLMLAYSLTSFKQKEIEGLKT